MLLGGLLQETHKRFAAVVDARNRASSRQIQLPASDEISAPMRRSHTERRRPSNSLEARMAVQLGAEAFRAALAEKVMSPDTSKGI